MDEQQRRGRAAAAARIHWNPTSGRIVTAYPGPPRALARYEALVAANPDVERKGATMPYTSRNGHMFSFLDPNGTIALRLSPAHREEFEATYKSRPVEQHGRILQDYVAIPKALLDDADELERWFERSWHWISSLKPKPTTRPRSAATGKSRSR